jgi:hypothetical protein
MRTSDTSGFMVTTVWGGRVFSRVPVATLSQARAEAQRIMVDSAWERGSTDGYPSLEDLDSLIGEWGGRVGPLPDGTVIEVLVCWRGVRSTVVDGGGASQERGGSA